jgi:uncharacterized membrane protein
MDWPTIIVAAVIGVIFVAIVATKVIHLRQGKHSCSCGGNCGACGVCHQASREGLPLETRSDDNTQ